LVGWQEGHPAHKKYGGMVEVGTGQSGWSGASWMFSVSASINLPLHHKVQKFSSSNGSPGWSWKKGCKTVVVWWVWNRAGHYIFALWFLSFFFSLA